MHPKIIQAIDVACARRFGLNKTAVWSTLNFLPGKIQLFAQNFEEGILEKEKLDGIDVAAESRQLFALDVGVRFGSARKRHFLFL